jgi:hypothetical protein
VTTTSHDIIQMMLHFNIDKPVNGCCPNCPVVCGANIDHLESFPRLDVILMTLHLECVAGLAAYNEAPSTPAPKEVPDNH